MFSESTCSGVSKISNQNFLHALLVTQVSQHDVNRERKLGKKSRILVWVYFGDGTMALTVYHDEIMEIELVPYLVTSRHINRHHVEFFPKNVDLLRFFPEKVFFAPTFG
jgi:hypothetical protein